MTGSNASGITPVGSGGTAGMHDAHRTVFTDIFDWMMVPVILLAPLGVGLIYLLSLSLADSALDQPLKARLRTFAEQIEWAKDQPRIDERSLAWIARDGRAEFAVMDLHGNTLLGSDELPLIRPGPAPELTFITGIHLEHQVRTAALRVQVPGAPGALVVAVAEAAHPRDVLAREILIEMAIATLIIVTLLVILMHRGLKAGLLPLESLRARLANRAPDDLSRLDIADAPMEVQPLVNAFNQLLERVREASTAQRRFIDNAAHQLRTPLAAINTQTQLALRTASGTSREALLTIEQGAQRLARLVNQLLVLSRAESMQGVGLELVPVDLCALAREVAEEMLQHATARTIDLGVDLPDTPVSVLGEPTLLRELLVNLADNAVKYSLPGGMVTLRVRPPGLLEVEDAGIGVPVEERERIFERFHRVIGTHATGSGLGLSIVREVAAHHGAAVALHASPAGGTRFTVSFAQPVPGTSAD